MEPFLLLPFNSVLRMYLCRSHFRVLVSRFEINKLHEMYLELIVSEKLFMGREGVKSFSEKLFMGREGVKFFSEKLFMGHTGFF